MSVYEKEKAAIVPTAHKIKSCPFCGANANAHKFDGPIWFIICAYCHCRTKGHPTESVAVHTWNRRSVCQKESS